jgi:rare lipoprotein A (peptidoglycan hydrolase)
MTCASWDYPFGERLVVINALTGKWVICRVNDRGPNKRLHRKVDLTHAAFGRISNPKKGFIYVAVISAGQQKVEST